MEDKMSTILWVEGEDSVRSMDIGRRKLKGESL